MKDVVRAGCRKKRQRERRTLIIASAVTGLAILATLVVALRISNADATPRGGVGDARVLAVLPFQPLSPDPNTAYFGLGLADSIIDHLSSVPGLTVRPMSAVLSLLERDADPVKAARRLRAKAVLVGRYQQVDGRFQVSAQLVDGDTGFALWSRTFESGLEDLMGLEEKVVRETSVMLMPDWSEKGESGRRNAAQHDASAHYLYLLARGKLATRESQPVSEAVELLEQAIGIDPDLAAAHALLAEASANMFYSGLTDDAAWIDRAIASGRRAIHLDGKDPHAHYALGYAMLVAGEPVEATREALRALELDPVDPYAQLLLSALLARAGLAPEARSLSERAKAGDPSLEYGWVDVRLAVAEGREVETVAFLEEMLEQRRAAGRSTERPVIFLGYMAFRTGDAAAALHWAAMLEEVSANKIYADMIRLQALSRTSDTSAVRRIIEKNQVAFQRDWEYCLWLAMALAQVGEKIAALDWLERSAKLGSCDLHLVESSRELDPLRADPRFQEVLSVIRGRAREIIQLAAFAGYR